MKENYENMSREQIIKAMKDAHNGCPLFEGREKASSLDELTEKIVTIEDIFKLTGNNGDYYAITFVEDPNHTYLSGGGLTKLCNDFGEHVKGVKIKIKPMIKLKNSPNDFRPIEVIG